MRGVNVNPMFPPAAPTPSQIRALGFDAVRFILRNTPKSREYHQACLNDGLAVLGMVTNETLETYGINGEIARRLTVASVSQLEGAIRRAVTSAMDDHPGLIGLECGNEPDDPGEASWTMDQETYIKFHNMCGDQAYDRNPRVTICTAGFVSGHNEYFRDIVRELSFQVVLLHPYLKTPQQGATLIGEYAQWIPRGEGKMIGASEWFPYDGDEETFPTMLDQRAAWGNFFFGWTDAMKPGQGLYAINGQLKHVGEVYSRYLLSTPTLANVRPVMV